MKLFFLYSIFLISMKDFNFKRLYGEHIYEVDRAVLKFKDESGKIYQISEFKKTIYNYPVRNAFVHTDKSDIITSFTFIFSTITDNLFYKKIIDDYGLPNSILKEDELLSHKKTIYQNAKYQDRKYSTKETTIEDKPTFVIWTTEIIEIRLIHNYKENTSQIKFIKRNQFTL